MKYIFLLPLSSESQTVLHRKMHYNKIMYIIFKVYFYEKKNTNLDVQMFTFIPCIDAFEDFT